ncbi:helix-turn-helix transcriptional regulator [Thalassolituus sp. LLYu03]|uniref:helix-turn-helix transcriptional regulator n=1 Tax=Thalassolituus sp. LLYu03 TaxID=3421656 RepID=UPI003D2774D4
MLQLIQALNIQPEQDPDWYAWCSALAATTGSDSCQLTIKSLKNHSHPVLVSADSATTFSPEHLTRQWQTPDHQLQIGLGFHNGDCASQLLSLLARAEPSLRSSLDIGLQHLLGRQRNRLGRNLLQRTGCHLLTLDERGRLKPDQDALPAEIAALLQQSPRRQQLLIGDYCIQDHLPATTDGVVLFSVQTPGQLLRCELHHQPGNPDQWPPAEAGYLLLIHPLRDQADSVWIATAFGLSDRQAKVAALACTGLHWPVCGRHCRAAVAANQHCVFVSENRVPRTGHQKSVATGGKDMAGSPDGIMMKPDTLELLNQYIQRIYAAILKPADILSVLDDLRHLVDAPYSSFQLESIETKHLRFAHLLGYDEQAIQDYVDYYIGVDPWTRLAYARNLLEADFTASDRIMKLADYSNTEFYADWGSPNDVVHAIGTGFRMDDGYILKITFQRGRTQGAFNEFNETFLSRLRPHFAEYVRLSPIFAQQQNQCQTFMDILQQTERPLLLVNAQCELKFANRHGERWLSNQNWMLPAQQRLHCRDRQLQNRLEASIHRACFPVFQMAGQPTSFLTLGEGDNAEAIWVIPVQAGQDQQEPMALLVARKSVDCPVALMVRYRLSRRQAELCLNLMQGLTLEETALAMNIRFNTARNTMITCFQKLAVSSQIQLIHFLLTDLRL